LRSFVFELPYTLEIVVWDDDGVLIKSDYIGRTTIDITKAESVKGQWKKLLPPQKYY
jgi:hypothetical protein